MTHIYKKPEDLAVGDIVLGYNNKYGQTLWRGRGDDGRYAVLTVPAKKPGDDCYSVMLKNISSNFEVDYYLDSPEFIVEVNGNKTSATDSVRNRYPHVCPRCKSPAYIGFVQVDCSTNCRV